MLTHAFVNDQSDKSELASHLRAAVTSPSLLTDPGPHMVLTDVVPARTYKLLLERIPPPSAFVTADRVKANFDPLDAGGAPPESRDAWFWFHTDVIKGLLTPMLLEVFRPLLASAYDVRFGHSIGEAVLNVPHRAFHGRLMLRRPGYRLKPHRDMKIAALTGLIYFARPGDSSDYGTDLYRVEDDSDAPFLKTYYPEDHGARAAVARVVPFVANTALTFMNVPGMAHGASIPREAVQSERYAYQFYVGPSKSKLARLIRQLPQERAALWRELEATPTDS